MGGRSKSRSSTTSNQRQISLDAKDNKGVAVAAGGNVNVSVLDGGAIKDAFDYSEEAGRQAYEFAGKAQGDSFRFAEAAQENAINLIEEGLDSVEELTTSSLLFTQKSYDNLLEKNRTENAQALDKITKYFFSVVGLIGGLYMVARL
jgi:hypothetical protein